MQEKSGLYQVEANDELSVILHVLGTANEGRIVFIVDEDGRTFHNRANLRVMQSYAQDRGRELAIVTTSQSLKELSQEEGVPCFVTVDEVRGRGSRVRRKKGKNLMLLLGWSALILLLILGGGYFYAVQNGAVLVVSPSTRPWQGELVVAVGPKMFTAKGERELTFTQSLSPKGRETIGVEPAKGTVSFFNNREEKIKVPKGTVVVAQNGQRYLTEKDIVVPSQQKQYVMTVAVGVNAGQAKVGVVAVQKGEAANAKVGAVKKMEGSLDEKLQVINTGPLTGGKDAAVAVVTKKDLETLETMLKNKAQQKVAQGLPNKEQILLADPAKLEVLEFVPKGKVGQRQDDLAATMKVKAAGRLVAKEELERAIIQQIGEKSGNWQPKKSNLDWQIIKVEPSADGFLLRINCQGTLMGKIDDKALSKELAGKTREQAQKHLGSLPEVDSFQLSLSRNKLPKWRRFIKVVLQGQ